MPVFLGQAAALVGGVLVSMAAQLMTERFIKHLVVQALEAVVKKTATDEDNRLLEEAKKAWNVES